MKKLSIVLLLSCAALGRAASPQGSKKTAKSTRMSIQAFNRSTSVASATPADADEALTHLNTFSTLTAVQVSRKEAVLARLTHLKEKTASLDTPVTSEKSPLVAHDQHIKMRAQSAQAKKKNLTALSKVLNSRPYLQNNNQSQIPLEEACLPARQHDFSHRQAFEPTVAAIKAVHQPNTAIEGGDFKGNLYSLSPEDRNNNELPTSRVFKFSFLKSQQDRHALETPGGSSQHAHTHIADAVKEGQAPTYHVAPHNASIFSYIPRYDAGKSVGLTQLSCKEELEDALASLEKATHATQLFHSLTTQTATIDHKKGLLGLLIEESIELQRLIAGGSLSHNPRAARRIQTLVAADTDLTKKSPSELKTLAEKILPTVNRERAGIMGRVQTAKNEARFIEILTEAVRKQLGKSSYSSAPAHTDSASALLGYFRLSAAPVEAPQKPAYFDKLPEAGTATLSDLYDVTHALMANNNLETLKEAATAKRRPKTSKFELRTLEQLKAAAVARKAEKLAPASAPAALESAVELTTAVLAVTSDVASAAPAQDDDLTHALVTEEIAPATLCVPTGEELDFEAQAANLANLGDELPSGPLNTLVAASSETEL